MKEIEREKLARKMAFNEYEDEKAFWNLRADLACDFFEQYVIKARIEELERLKVSDEFTCKYDGWEYIETRIAELKKGVNDAT